MSALTIERGPRLLHDKSGAALVTGIGMGTFLIGVTWFVFGIARTLAFRDRVQEAADAGAFSSAVIQAKGMNLIAAINLVFFALTAIWVVLRTFEHIMYKLQSGVTSPIGNADNCHGIGCHAFNPCEARAALYSGIPGGAVIGSQICNVAYTLQELRDATKDARKAIGDVMDRTFPPLSTLQNATARLAPAAGTVSSLALGAKFGHFTMAVGTSLVPGHDLNELQNQAAGNPPLEDNGAPLGLPVVEEKFGMLCKRTAVIAGNKVKDAFGAIPILGDALDLPIISDVVDGFINSMAGVIQHEFCSDWDWAGNSSSIRIFGQKGPKTMYKHAKNGSDYTQVWAFTRGEMDDRDMPKVRIATRDYSQEKPHHSGWYIAQAEYYFDCTGSWDDGGCNGNDNAVFNMRWRARLRRVRVPNVAANIGQHIHHAVLESAHDALEEALGLNTDTAPIQNAGDLIDQSVVGGLFEAGWGQLTSQLPAEPDPGAQGSPSAWIH